MKKIRIEVPINLLEEEFLKKKCQNKEFTKVEACMYILMYKVKSINFVAKTFGWSRAKTKNFLVRLEKEGFLCFQKIEIKKDFIKEQYFSDKKVPLSFKEQKFLLSEERF
ncbi:hypothetical protein JYT99_01865 [bacterium AH-315-E09]|nr:hypothetical protein [bacterium AH-315-E09]